MRLPTKQLINKIEHLSKDLSPAQLGRFLDIIDAMTALVEDAATVDLGHDKNAKSSEQSTSSVIH
ncbi:hypothetical protein GTQ48_10025 [Alteromonas genovensis]|uniref:Uncharacterized protein n=1 Tax=Alteromonas genovensis TaxID=471225 RepID=A0A6N9TEW4_9ALTE|nr:hypothetical protein [Alteromonas genovensis]NDW15854.1 hypothetical protein [Alteromonas genovensis]